MHPLLGHGRRLALYFSAWVPLGILLGYLLHSGGGVSAPQAAELAAPLAFLYAFVCLSSWYLCWVWPTRGGLESVVGVQLT
ncbi:MAG TPA: hypothetical protein VN515_06350, partial [Terriglobales bacterium]|nr:hypothetical protein [Terriglobales bacterium]